ncbi:aspartic proteinase nepenthesin-1-like [Cryptomeria japonica]|uniref:aspartic proteinase nepenthesin-1-like n=1 Tax=Cryptomeria japonica TaxID=3369 RepID=UPI0027DA3FD5|nr:aspartic proteinase nepenthesin-1-like [Cryptomeria japonica]
MCMISCSCGRVAWTKTGENLGLTRVELSRREPDLSFSERLKGAVVRSKSRSQKIDAIVKKAISKQLDAESPVHVGDGEFLMKVGVGSPSVSFDAIVDTGSDLIWTQCMPCIQCYKQPSPIFDPSKSSTYSKVPCGSDLCNALQLKYCSHDCTYLYLYGDLSSTSGVLSYETFTIGNATRVPEIAFGCGNNNQGEGFQQGGGLVGLGRGPLSLTSQLASKSMVDSKFSYCLLPITDSTSKTSPLFFGNDAALSGAKTLELIRSSTIPTFWYIPITGITVDGSALDIPPGTFDLKANGSGGMIIDSGTTVTILDEAAYSPLKAAIQSAVHLTPADGSSTGLDLCYKMPSAGSVKPTFPSLTFNFKGGIDYEIPTENYFIEIDDGKEQLLCLAVLGSSGLLASGPSIFGNVQQQNYHILYNDADNILSFKPTTCDSL